MTPVIRDLPGRNEALQAVLSLEVLSRAEDTFTSHNDSNYLILNLMTAGGSMRFSSLFVTAMLTSALTIATPLPAQTPSPSPRDEKSKTAPDLSNVVGLTDLKIEMAESRVKLSGSPQATLDLVVALEDYLNTSCMGKLPYTLTYAGNPTDPVCIARMQRVLEINPGNPVGLCTRDGITAQSCIEAYQNQRLESFDSSSRLNDLDPSLKVGLSAADAERIVKIEESLAEVDRKYQSTTLGEEKMALIKDASTLYDQALSIACKPSALSLRASEESLKNSEPAEIAQARSRLLQIPSAIRADYQGEMLEKAEREFASGTLSPERRAVLVELMKVIENPEAPMIQPASSLTRTRVVLMKCYELIAKASMASPDLPSSTCHREGWYSPQCITAIKKWRNVQKSGGAKSKTGTPTPASMISTF